MFVQAARRERGLARTSTESAAIGVIADLCHARLVIGEGEGSQLYLII